MDVSDGELGGIKLAAFSKTRLSKSEQWEQLQECDSVSCVACHTGQPAHICYIEPKDDKELMNGDDMRIWYFICHQCLCGISALSLRSLLMETLKCQRN